MHRFHICNEEINKTNKTMKTVVNSNNGLKQIDYQVDSNLKTDSTLKLLNLNIRDEQRPFHKEVIH